MNITQLVKAVLFDEKTPPKGAIVSEVSSALQEHEVAVAKLNRIACDIQHGENCTCCEVEQH